MSRSGFSKQTSNAPGTGEKNHNIMLFIFAYIFFAPIKIARFSVVTLFIKFYRMKNVGKRLKYFCQARSTCIEVHFFPLFAIKMDDR